MSHAACVVPHRDVVFLLPAAVIVLALLPAPSSPKRSLLRPGSGRSHLSPPVISRWGQSPEMPPAVIPARESPHWYLVLEEASRTGLGLAFELELLSLSRKEPARLWMRRLKAAFLSPVGDVDLTELQKLPHRLGEDGNHPLATWVVQNRPYPHGGFLTSRVYDFRDGAWAYLEGICALPLGATLQNSLCVFAVVPVANVALIQ